MNDAALEHRLGSRFAELAAPPSHNLLDDVLAEVAVTAQRGRGLPAVSLTGRGLLLLAGGLLLLGLAAGAIALSHPTPSLRWLTDARWESVSLPTPSGAAANRVSPEGIVAFRGGYVAVGGASGPDGWGSADDIGAIWHTAPGAQWHLVEAPGMAGAIVHGVATDGQRLVAVGERVTDLNAAGFSVGAAWSSEDGETWTLATGGPAWFAGPIAYSAGTFVAIGGGAPAGSCQCVLWTSADGATWRQTTFIPEQLVHHLRVTSRGLVVMGGGGYRKGDEGMSYVSTDGVTWHRSPAGQADLLNMGLSDVASVGDRLIGLGWYDAIAPTITPGPYVMSSSDGLLWTRGVLLSSDTRAVPSALAVVDGTIVVMLNEPSGVFVLTSRDGTTWNQASSAASNGPDAEGIAAWAFDAERGFVAVGGTPHGPMAWTPHNR